MRSPSPGEPWEEAMSRNDLAHLRMEQGDIAGAEAELARAELDAPLGRRPRRCRRRGRYAVTRGVSNGMGL